MWQTLKYGKYLQHRLDVDLNSVHEDDRCICSAEHPNGIYSNLAEFVETEQNIEFEDFCYSLGIDPEINRYAVKIKWSNE